MTDHVAGVTSGEQEEPQASKSNTQDTPSGWTTKGLERLDKVARLNANPTWVNDDLYRLLYREDLYVVAYERIKSNPGNMTAGVDGSTLDGFSMNAIRRIIESLRDGSFDFARARRVYIPKPNGKKRPLGVASPLDKVVQEVLRMVLEAIYDSPHGSSFHVNSHGFRPGRGTHTALQEIRKNWSGVIWFVEGDIKGCFDNIDHTILMNILRKRISDERFLGIIWKALRCGYLEFKVPVNSLIGTPQGSIVSPILANVFLHEFDEFVSKELIAKLEVGVKKQQTKAYKRVNYHLTNARRAHASASDEQERGRWLQAIRQLKIDQQSIPAYEGSSSYIRIKFVRYADDWLIGINGPKRLAEDVREWCATFLTSIGLTLSPEKTKITHAKTQEARFLGTRLSVGTSNPRRTKVSHRGISTTKRTAGWTPIMRAPIGEIVHRLHDRGMCTAQGWPTACKRWLYLDDVTIVTMYNSVLRGYLNFYSFADNFQELARIQYILLLSLAKTLGHKHRLPIGSVFKKHGNPIVVRIEQGDKSSRSVAFAANTSWKRQPNRFLINENFGGPDGTIRDRTRSLQRSKLGQRCVICGSTENIEMHHLRHIRKMGKRVRGFAKLMASINRKQVPLCQPHHVAVHSGKYDGIRLADLFDASLAAA